jgi:hypothetical protein
MTVSRAVPVPDGVRYPAASLVPPRIINRVFSVFIDFLRFVMGTPEQVGGSDELA